MMVLLGATSANHQSSAYVDAVHLLVRNVRVTKGATGMCLCKKRCIGEGFQPNPSQMT